MKNLNPTILYAILGGLFIIACFSLCAGVFYLIIKFLLTIYNFSYKLTFIQSSKILLVLLFIYSIFNTRK
jgi:hypothetical protein